MFILLSLPNMWKPADALFNDIMKHSLNGIVHSWTFLNFTTRVQGYSTFSFSLGPNSMPGHIFIFVHILLSSRGYPPLKDPAPTQT